MCKCIRSRLTTTKGAPKRVSAFGPPFFFKPPFLRFPPTDLRPPQFSQKPLFRKVFFTVWKTPLTKGGAFRYIIYVSRRKGPQNVQVRSVPLSFLNFLYFNPYIFPIKKVTMCGSKFFIINFPAIVLGSDIYILRVYKRYVSFLTHIKKWYPAPPALSAHTR